jgi:hypothetical protein
MRSSISIPTKGQQYFSMLFLGITVIGILALSLQVPSVQAQETTLTPTIAPSKTPVPAATESVNRTSPIRSLTQVDLSILTGNVQRPNGVVWHNDKLYVSCSGDWTLYVLDDTNGVTQTYISGVRNAHTLYAETNSNNELILWTPDFQNNSLLRVSRQGVQTIASNLNGPWGITNLDDETFLVSNLLNNSVTAITRDGEVSELVNGLMSPTGLAHDETFLYIGNNGSTRRAIEWFDLETSDTQTQPLISGLQNVTGLAMGDDGYLYFAYSLGTRGVVGRVKPGECRENGGCTQDQVEIVVLTELAAPIAGLTLSPDMRLYIHTMFSPDIYWVQLPVS